MTWLHKADGITIGMANWNHRLFLPRSVNSARQALQTLATRGVPGELIVVDDASRDGSVEWLAQASAWLSDLPLRVSFQPHQQGPAAARNRILQMARYRYICWLDADNILQGANLWLFWRAIRETGAAVVYGNLIVKEDGRVRALTSNVVYRSAVFHMNETDMCSLCDARQLLQCGGLQTEPSINSNEDWELFLHLADDGRLIVFVPAVFGTYYVRRQSLSYGFTPPNAVVRRMHDHQRHRSLEGRILGRVYHPDIGWLV
ncbi:MAG: glycosyltransferase family A protein [Chloracidobacterium sp.]|uniref:Glycosyltransferase family 2 protein n=1 Tax=Chloracidobacterium validum TaxID=2821543 RepID=A0ABX8BDU0_9BACT|nr:glycosyltransferase family A protein [Chloracidobacterium validum]QUW04577.1 glycosyltransferase family 2 protein [Chloracidobacterium validum]